MSYIVELSSDVYGTEIFEYDTYKEAVEGMKRLIEATQRQYKEDGIRREVSSPIFIEDEKNEVADMNIISDLCIFNR